MGTLTKILATALALVVLSDRGTRAAGTDDLRTWGFNDNGQLGDGTIITPRTSPQTIAGLPNVVAVHADRMTAIGGGLSFVLLNNGTLMGTGNNIFGQIGNGSNTSPRSFVPVSGITTAVAVSAGLRHMLALLSDGTVRAWGSNTTGELGNNGEIRIYSAPVTVLGLTNVKGIAAGDYYSLAVLNDGTVMAWGFNGLGQLGDGSTTDRPTPVPVPGLSGVVKVAAGGYSSYALLSNGTVMSWGNNADGNLGDGTTNSNPTPTLVPNLAGVVDISIGTSFALVLLSNGTVKGWGRNSSSQLGDGTTATRLSPVSNIYLSGVAAIAAGGSHALAQLNDGTLKAWGNNSKGQLGDGTTTARTSPVTVPGLSGVVGIAAGGQHSLALTPPGGNLAPCVIAGSAQTVVLPSQANLAGLVKDDGRPTATLTVTWSKISGPGGVAFGNIHAAVTTAAFGQPGTYVLGLTASDGALSTSSNVTITVTGANPGDINGDGVVNVDDLNAVTSNFGKTYP